MALRSLLFLFSASLILSCGDDAAPPAIKKTRNEKPADSTNPNVVQKEAVAQDPSLPDLEKAYALHPEDKEALYNLAYGYAERKNTKALSLSDTLLKYNRTESAAFAWYIKATYYASLGDEKQSLKFYDSSIIADHVFLDSYMDKGQLLFKQKKFNEALKAFAQGQAVASKDAKAEFFYWVGKTFEQLGDKQNAKDNYERAYDLDKTIIEAKQAADRLNS